ncbi:hypothetical protein [Bosea sp. AS-1]|jgi:hypothetical protein|uniref:hypothetical protein n=1 Tax=Bosea sp. AS-1 TaxID=2015316 RepID=UPI000B79695B|nr:hypothetical protein [Bosea sp. AS-1]
MKKHNRLSQASHLAKMRREQVQHRKEREARFPKPALVPKTDDTAPLDKAPVVDTPEPSGKTPR